MSRANLPLAEMKVMPNFYFYVDEFQSFANATFANILSEARKYHLNLIIAHQYIEQMEEEVRDAVFGNVGTTISFRVGPFDAETLETVFTPRFLAADLVNLGFAQIYLTMMIDGIGSQPFSAVTLPPIAPPSVSCKDMVIAASRRNFTKPRIEVEKIVTDLHTPEKIEKKSPVVKPSPKPRMEEKIIPRQVPTLVSFGSAPVVVPIASPEPVPLATVNPAPAPTSAPIATPAPREMVKRTFESTARGEKPAFKKDTKPTTVHTQAAPTRDRERKPVASEHKKPAPDVHDLRSVLAKIAQGSTRDEKDKDKEKPQSYVASESGEATFKKIDTAISPLKAALEQLKKVDTTTPPRVLPPRPFPLPTSFTPASGCSNSPTSASAAAPTRHSKWWVPRGSMKPRWPPN